MRAKTIHLLLQILWIFVALCLLFIFEVVLTRCNVKGWLNQILFLLGAACCVKLSRRQLN